MKANCGALLSSAHAAFDQDQSEAETIDETDNRHIRRETSVVSVSPSDLPNSWSKTVTGFIRVKRSGVRYNSTKLTKKQKKKKEMAAKTLKKSMEMAKMAEKSVKNTTATPVAPNPESKEPSLGTASTSPGTELKAVAPSPGTASPSPGTELKAVAPSPGTASPSPEIELKDEKAPKKEKSKNAVQFEETAYYAIVKQKLTAKQGADVCLKHWGIEGMHRAKDVNFNEDKNRIKNPSIASNLSQIFNYALNILVLTGQKSVTIATEILSNKIKRLFDLVATVKNYLTN